MLAFVIDNLIWFCFPLSYLLSFFLILFVHDSLVNLLDAFLRGGQFGLAYLQYLADDIIMALHFQYILQRLAFHSNVPYHYTAGFGLRQGIAFHFIGSIVPV